jgi:hypothetical protein
MKSSSFTLFLDSGAHSLWEKYVGSRSNKEGYAFYDSQTFWDYVDRYASFLKDKENAHTIDYYANVDVIFDPKRTWKVQKYLEKTHGLKPIPVLHYDASTEWLGRYLDAGYEFIGFGGIGQGLTVTMYQQWADKMFDYLCPPPSYLPRARIHGFAMTSFSLMWRYPWWSVDSSTWTKSGAFGRITYPKRRGGIAKFDEEPESIRISEDAPVVAYYAHYRSLPPAAQNTLLRWLEEINIPLGDENTVGVLNNHSMRKLANLYFFEGMRKALPPWPWPFRLAQAAHNCRANLLQES